ncbi:MAG: CpXC domain-containing protein [Myxococcota bacterium]
MSSTQPVHIRCPRCGDRFPAQLFLNLHVTRSPESRHMILDGRFSMFDCPACGARIRAEPTMLYSDFEKWKWYGVFPRAALRHRGALVERLNQGFRFNLEVAAPPMVREWAPRFTRRAVFGLASLRDKLLCEDHGLDDRALEVLKWMVLRESAPRAIHPETDVHLHHVDGDQLALLIEPPPGPDGTVVARLLGVDRGRLAEAAGLVGKLYPDGEVVDWRAPLWPDEPLDEPLAFDDRMAL